MPVRTTETAVTFRQRLMLPELGRPQPAGAYRLTTEEEEIAGLSFLALRCGETMLRLPSLASSADRNK